MSFLPFVWCQNLCPKSFQTAPLLAQTSARCHGEPLGLALSLEAPDIQKRMVPQNYHTKLSWWLNQPTSKKVCQIGNRPPK